VEFFQLLSTTVLLQQKRGQAAGISAVDSGFRRDAKSLGTE
jgi:hypothetical protein